MKINNQNLCGAWVGLKFILKNAISVVIDDSNEIFSSCNIKYIHSEFRSKVYIKKYKGITYYWL